MPDTQAHQMLVNEQYLTIKKIGQGGFGSVWRAYDFSLRNFVAIKELIKEYTEEMKFIEMFYKEALIAKNIIHDNIVRVQHFWKGSNGSYYISMDYVVGQDLEYLIRKCNKLSIKIPWELAIVICGSVLKAIDHANRLAKDTISGKPYGIVYRDISPGNIMLSFDGNVRLSDFGIAKTADELSDGIKHRVVTGKYAYMSPEQVKGDPSIDHRSDIFSIGLVLFEMLSGKSLYHGDPRVIKQQVLEEHFDPTTLCDLNLPDELIEIVSKSLEKERSLRYEKAIEMFRDLRRLLKGKETEELTEELADFTSRVLQEEIIEENEFTERVKQLSLQDIKLNPSVVKIACKDFIVGEDSALPDSLPQQSQPLPQSRPQQPRTQQPYRSPFQKMGTPVVGRETPPPVSRIESQPDAPVIPRSEPLKGPEFETAPDPAGRAAPAAAPSSVPEMKPRIEPPAPSKVNPAPVSPRVDMQPPAAPPYHPPTSFKVARPPVSDARPAQFEEKGKTVFEEVGDWLVNKYRVYRRRFVRVLILLFFTAVLFGVADTFLRLTPFGRMAYSRLNPPDTVITTVPEGAIVSMKSRDGKVVLANVSSSDPIELRKVPPRTYIISATKEGFKPVERIVRIEESGKMTSNAQRIQITFDFVLSVNSDPQGATVYIDGNKFNVTPCKAELIAGEHTVKLALKGFEDLGSLAKENKDGRCNIDFTRSNLDSVFGGVDPKYWNYQMMKLSGETVFSLTGRLFKKVNVNSVPSHMMLHVQGEGTPRGATPLTLPLKVGDYSVRFLDPDGRYEETTRVIKVNENSSTDFTAYLNKWVTLRVRSKEDPDESFMTTVHVSGSGVNISREISTGKPVRLALPLGVYKVFFSGDSEYKGLTIPNVNIAEKSLVVGELEYENTTIHVRVKDDATGEPLANAYVWMQGQLVGKTDANGVWEKGVRPGDVGIRIVAKGYIEKTWEKKVRPGKEEVELSLPIEVPSIEVSSDTYETSPQRLTNDRRTPPPSLPQAPTQVIKREPDQKTSFTVPPASSPNGRNVIVCPNCGKSYVVGPIKLRFCTNCGKPFKY